MASIDILYSEAVDSYLKGNIAKSSTLCQKVLQKNQKDDKALNLFGLIQGLLGKGDIAISFFERAIKANPKNIEAMTNLANGYQNQKDYSKALEVYGKAIELDPTFAKSYYNAALALREIGDNEQAKVLLRKCIELEPDFIEPYTNLAAIFKDQNDLEEALASLVGAPIDERVLSTGALILSKLMKHDEALEGIGQAIELKPNHEMLNNQGIILSNAKRDQKAIYSYLQAISVKNDFDTAYSNMAASFLNLGDEQKAKGALLKAISINPDSASNYVNFGFYLKKIGDVDGAQAVFLKALEIDPKNKPAATNLGILQLYKGSFRDGFALYESRVKEMIKCTKPLWNGEDLLGKRLFVYHEQGFGDTLNFSRLLFDERLASQDVVFMPQKELYSLFLTSSLPARVVSGEEALSEDFTFDYHLPLMSLPYYLGLESAFGNVNYINIDTERKDYFASKLSGIKSKKIGIVWQGNKDYSGDADRSIKLSMLGRFLDAGYALVSLQKNIDETEFESFAKGREVFEFSSDISSFADTAALIASLDCVLSVDTSVAHLAGILNKPTFLLLPFMADWRWRDEGEKSDWYESMMLCRQSERGVWEPALGKAFEGIKGLLG